MTAYAKRHGYAAIVATARIDASRPPAWSKLLLIESYLEENSDCNWLLWIDADALIANPEQRLEDLVNEDFDFLVAADHAPSPINTGVFLIRNCPAALAMLRRAYAKSHFRHHPNWEQPAVAEALRECAESLRTRVVARRLLNSFAIEFEKGDFIVHFAGWSPAAKLAGVKNAIATLAKSFDQPVPALPVSRSTIVDDLLPLNSGSVPIVPKLKNPSARPWDDLPPIFCITCWQTPQRSKLAAEHFRERGLDIQFFPGIHGKSFGLRTALITKTGHRIAAGEVGCFLSHYMLWQTLAYLPHDEILILEDDAWFEPDFRSRFREAYADLPNDWQFVYVGSTLIDGKPVERISNRVGLMRYPCGTHAYLVKRSSLSFLLQTNHQARYPIDMQLMENSLPAMRCYTFTPSLVKQRGSPSPVEGTGENWSTTTAVPDDDFDLF